jgi:hypothetical protein
MEMVAMDMKGRGIFLSRTLSYRGATFDIAEEKVDGAFTALYDIVSERVFRSSDLKQWSV